MDSGAKTIRFHSATGLFLFLLVVGWCQADVELSNRTVNKNYMWIAAVASGVGALFLMAVILIISTIFIRRYEKKRLQEILCMAPIIIRATSPDDAGPKGFGHPGPSSAVETDTRSPGHVYYNRAMDIDETPEVGSPTLLLQGGPGKSSSSPPLVPKRSGDVSVC